MNEIKKRKDGRWYTRLEIGYKNDGSPAYKYIYGSSKKEVAMKVNDYENQTHVETNKVSEHHTHPMCAWTLNQMIEFYLETYKKSAVKETTFGTICSAYRTHIKDSIGRMQIVNIASSDIQRFINDKSKTLSRGRVVAIKCLLNEVFDYAVNNDIINKSPTTIVNIPMGKHRKYEKIEKLYSEEDLEKLKKEIYNNDLVYAPAFILLWNTGMRIGELQALTWKDVNLNERFISINKNYVQYRTDNGTYERDPNSTTKTRSSVRDVPLNDTAIEALREMRRRQELNGSHHTYVLQNKNGTFVTHSSIQNKFKKICMRAGVEYRGLHAFRHTFATNLLVNGIDVNTTSKLLGHYKPSMTLDIYCHTVHNISHYAVTTLDKLTTK